MIESIITSIILISIYTIGYIVGRKHERELILSELTNMKIIQITSQKVIQQPKSGEAFFGIPNEVVEIYGLGDDNKIYQWIEGEWKLI